MIQNLNSPIIPQWNTDSQGNKISVMIENETHQVVNCQIVLNQIPDKANRVQIDNMYEINNGELGENNFKVDYNNNSAIVSFHPSKEAQFITVKKYYGRGLVYIPATRIYDDSTGQPLPEIDKTLQDYIDSIKPFGYKGEYDNTIIYQPNSSVYYPLEKGIYKCIKTSQGFAPTNTEYWELMLSVKDVSDYAEQQGDYAKNQGDYAKAQGDLTNTATTNANTAIVNLNNTNTAFQLIEAYNPAKPYIPMNKVTYQGSTYQNIVGCTGVLPTDTSKWILVAQKGTDGLLIAEDFTPESITIDNDIAPQVQAKLGNLANLQTTDKSNLVNAINENRTSLNDIKKQETNLKLTDLSPCFKKDGFVSVITGDSLSYNRYDFDATARTNAYDCFLGMTSWSFMLKDAIHRNDKYFKHGDEVRFRNVQTNTTFEKAEKGKYYLNFNGRNITFNVLTQAEEIILPINFISNSSKAVLYIASNPENTACSFDVYIGATLVGNFNTDGTGKKYQGYEIIAISIPITNYLEQEIKLTNFVQTASVPDGTGKRTVRLLGIGSKYSPVYLTGQGSQPSQWLVDNLQSRVLDYNPDFVSIIIGANDIALGVTKDTYEANLRTIVSGIRTARPNCQIFLMTTTSNSNISDTITAEYNDRMQKVALDTNCYFIDCLKLFSNINPSDWHFDNIHMKRYGNEILCKTVLKTIMPNGIYPKEMVDTEQVYYNNAYRKDSENPVNGFLYITYNGSTLVWDLVRQTDKYSDVISVDKIADYKIRINFKYSCILDVFRGFITIKSIYQLGSPTVNIRPNVSAYGINYIEINLYKSDGTLVSAGDLVTASNFMFAITY